jgi:phage-related protein
MAQVDELKVLITANAKNFDRQIKAVKQQMGDLGKQASSQGKQVSDSIGGMVKKYALLAAAIAATYKVISASTKEFGDFEQNVGGAKAIFGEYAGYVQKKAVEAANTMGMSMNEYMKTANKIGASMQGSGMSQAESLQMTTDWMQRAADQASVMGVTTTEAMDAITAAAKGNFMLMDNIGVKMNATTLEAYAMSKGINQSYDSMSEAQKVGLAYQLFLERTNYAAGNFAREGATTLNGSLATLKANFANLGAMLGQAFAPVIMQVAQFISNYLIPALQAVIPYIIGFMQVVGQMVSFVMGALSGLFGGGKKSADSMTASANSAAASVGSVGAAATGAGDALGGAAKQAKKLKGQLAGFDEMNVLHEPQDSGGGAGGGGAGGGGAGMPAIDMSGFENFNPFGDMEDKAKRVAEAIKGIFGDINLQPLIKSLGELWKGLQNVGSGFVKIGKAAFDNFIKPVVKYLVESALPRLFDGIGKALQSIDFDKIAASASVLFKGMADLLVPVLNIVVDIITNYLAPIVVWLFNDILPPILEIVGQALTFIGQILTDIWNIISPILDAILPPLMEIVGILVDMLQPVFEAIFAVLGAVWAILQPIVNLLVAILKPILEVIIGVLKGLITILASIITWVADIIKVVADAITWAVTHIGDMVKAIGDFFVGLWEGIVAIFQIVGKWFTDRFNEAVQGIKTVFSVIGSFFQGCWNAVVNVFSGVASWFGNVFTNAWNAIKNVFSAVGSFFQGIWNTITNIFTSIGTTIGNAVSGAFKAVVNAILGFVEGFINAPVRAINALIDVINMVPGINLGKLGELKLPRMARGGIVTSSTVANIGENGAEAVLPLENNTEWMDMLASKISGGQPVQITVNVGEETLIDKVIEGINDASFMRNANVINV